MASFIKFFIILFILSSFAFAENITINDGGITYSLEIDTSNTNQPSASSILTKNNSAINNNLYNNNMAFEYANKAFYIPASLNFSKVSVSVKSMGDFVLKDFSPASSFFSSASTNTQYLYPVVAYNNTTLQSISVGQNNTLNINKNALYGSAGLGYQIGNGFRFEIIANTGYSLTSSSKTDFGVNSASFSTGTLDIVDKTSSNTVVGRISQTDTYTIGSSASSKYKASLGFSLLGYYDFVMPFTSNLLFAPYVGGGVYYSSGKLSLSRNITVKDDFNGNLTGVNVGYPDYSYSGTSFANYDSWGSDRLVNMISPIIILGTSFATAQLKKLNIILDFNVKLRLNLENNHTYSLAKSIDPTSYYINNTKNKCLNYCDSPITADINAINVPEASDYSNLIAEGNSVSVSLPKNEVIFSLGFRYNF